jgi:hypothetical protein
MRLILEEDEHVIHQFVEQAMYHLMNGYGVFAIKISLVMLCDRSAVRATWSSDAERRGVVPWWGSGTVYNNAPTVAASASTSRSRHHLSSAPVASGKNQFHVLKLT